MIVKRQLIALYTIVRRECVRMFRIASQVFLPPVITTALYFLIFGTLLGQRVGTINHVHYGTFIAPGLIIMSVITNSYGNVSSSFFSLRFQRSIEELLVSPISDELLLLGYVCGGLIRGILVALLVYLVSSALVPIEVVHPWLAFLVILAVSMIFSLAGFMNAMFARNFDDIMIVPTFILSPLSYLGGVFYSTSMLSPFWQKVSLFNPVLYMVQMMRYAMLGIETANFHLIAAFILGGVLLGLLFLNLTFLKKGIGLRD